MKPLNQALISRAYLRFLGNFSLLLLSLLVVVYFYFRTLFKQPDLVAANQTNYNDIIFEQQLMQQRMDTIYFNLQEINQLIMPAGNPRPRQRVALDEKLVMKENLVLDEKKALDKLIGKRAKRQHHEVYRKLSSQIKELLLLKDSIATTAKQARSLKQELDECRYPGSSTKMSARKY